MASRAGERRQEPQPDPAGSPAPEGEPLRVLIVDDDPDDRALVRRLLAKAGRPFVCDEAGSIFNMFEKLAPGRHDLVILDHLLPDGNTFDVIERLHAARIQIPLVVITGCERELLDIELREKGVASFLPKERLNADTLARTLMHAYRSFKAESATRGMMKRFESFEFLVNRGPGVVCLWRVAEDWPVDFVSENVRAMLGYNAEDFTSGRVNWAELVHPEDRPRIEQEVAAHFAAADSEYAQEYRIRTAGGDYRWVEDRNLVMRDGQGRPVHVQGIVIDVTARKQAEQELKRLNEELAERVTEKTASLQQEISRRQEAEKSTQFTGEYLRTLISASHDGILVIDAEGRLEFGNDSAFRILGWPREELIGTHFIRFIPAEAHEFILARWAEVQRGEAQPYEVDILRQDGGRSSILVSHRKMMMGFQPKYCVVIKDYTERKKAGDDLRESRALLMATVESLPFDFFAIGPDGRYILQNSACRDHWGEIVGKRPEESAPNAATAETWKTNNQRAFLGETVHSEVDFDAQGRRGFLHSIVTPIRDGERVLGIAGVNIDITDQRNAQEALRHARDELEQRVEERTVELTQTNRRLQKEIIDRMRAEDQLRVSEERFRTQYKNTPIPTYTWRWMEDDLVLVDYNEAAVRFTAGGIARFVGARAREMHRDRPDVIKDLHDCFQSKTPIEREMSYRMLSTNEERVLVVRYIFVRPDLVMVHTEDITDRRRAEEIRRASEERFRALIERSTEAVMIVGSDAAIQYASPSAKKITGRPPEALAGAGLFANVHLDDQAMCRQAFARVAARAGATEAIDIRLRDTDGRWLCIEGVARNLSDNPAVGGIVINFRDVTARKNAEERQRRLTEGLRAIVNVADQLIACEDVDELCRRAVELGRRRLGFERCSIYLQDGDVRRGTYGTNRAGKTTDEHAHVLHSDDAWEQAFRLPNGEDLRWLIAEGPLYEWNGSEMAEIGAGWVVRTPIAQAGARPLGFFFNDTAVSHEPLDPIRQDTLAVFCSMLAEIMERKKVEQALRESEIRFRELSELLPQTIFEMNLDGRLTFANRHAFETFGHTQSEFDAGLNGLNMFVPEDRERAASNIRSILEGRSLRANEYTALCKDGRRIPILVYSSPVRRAGRTVGLRGIIIDVTDLKLAEKRQAAITRDLRAVVDTADELICCEDLDQVYRQAVELARERLGIERCSIFTDEGDVIRGTYGTDMAGRTTDERRFETPKNEDWQRMFRMPAGSDARWCEEKMTRHEWDGVGFNDLETAWVVCTPIAREGGRAQAVFFNDTAITHDPPDPAKQDVLAVLCSLLADIIERKRAERALRESEEKFRTLVENLDIGVYRHTGRHDGTFLQANPALARIFGCADVDELMAVPLSACCADSGDCGRFVERLSKAGLIKNQELRLRRRDGSLLWGSCTAKATFSPAGEMLWMDGVIEDITARKLADEERQQLSSRLLDIQEQERKEISAALHDHLGQLLFLTRLDLGSLNLRDAAARTAVKNAIARTDEALQAVRDIAISLRPPMLDDLGFEAAIEVLMDDVSKRTSMTVRFEKQDEVPGLKADVETCLYRVLQEALTNVAKHAGATTVHVSLSAPGGDVMLGVRDNGRGLAATDAATPGGIGLIGMRERLRRCGGMLEVGSEPGGGTVLTARIPLAQAVREGGAP